MLSPELAPDDTASSPRLRCVLICDLADSTALIERLGDSQASVVLREHDRIARQALVRHHGQEIDKTDGFLALFERPIEAVAFAIDYQQQLARLGQENGALLQTRVGIHVGEVLSWRNRPEEVAGGAKPVEVEGLAKAIAARLMTLADPGQILLSESAYSLALRARDELPTDWNPRWKEHGHYRLHGVSKPLPVFEVAAGGRPPLPPRNKIKARRLRPWYRWPPIYALLALALVAAPLWYLLKPAPAIAFVERDWLLVGDLRNLSTDRSIEAPLDYALRLGLEQSRHLNTISRSRTREGLAQMALDPNTQVDRDRGSELALRLGARALLLPTVHQSGGRLRFTAELVDPHTQATVYSHFQDALEPDQLIGAIDAVLRDLRGDLGESLAAIDNSGPPLAQVTSPSLDAVRALVAANQAKREQRYDAAHALVEEALRLDQDFALAYLARSTLHLIDKHYLEAEEDLMRAAARVERLSQRERLLIEATRNSYGATRDMLGAWRAFVDLYPDDARARYNLAYFAIEFGNDCGPALKDLPPGPQETVADKGMRRYEIARCLLITGDLEGARAEFAEANASGLIGNGPEFALSLAVAGELAAARTALDLRDGERPQSEREVASQARLSLLLLQGDWAGFLEALDQLVVSSADWPLTGRSMVVAMRRSVAPYAQEPDWQAQSQAELARLLDLAAASSRQEARSVLDQSGAIAWSLARHASSPDIDLLDRWARAASDLGPQPLRDMTRLVEAQRRLRDGDSAAALASLQEVDPARAPYLFRATRMHALLDSGEVAAALNDCRWLQSQTGRAVAERVAGGALHATNLTERAMALARFDSSLPGECPADSAARALVAALPTAASAPAVVPDQD